MGGLVRTGPRIGPGSGCSWAPTRDRPMAPSRVGVVSRTAPEAMATGPPTREPPHLPTSLAGRSPEKLPRLVREASGMGCRIFNPKCQGIFSVTIYICRCWSGAITLWLHTKQKLATSVWCGVHRYLISIPTRLSLTILQFIASAAPIVIRHFDYK
jgi:hypothetical protein